MFGHTKWLHYYLKGETCSTDPNTETPPKDFLLGLGYNPMAEQFAILLAGGLGTRLWPLSRGLYPKQLMRISKDGSFLQQAARRAMQIVPPQNIITVTTDAQYLPIKDQLSEINLALCKNILIEPSGRNTAAAITVAAMHSVQKSKTSVLVVMPADHSIQNMKPLTDALNGAIDVASNNWLVTFGIKPTRPETGFGYLQQGQKLDTDFEAFKVKSFIEKPGYDDAKKLVSRKGIYWNSGIFVFSAKHVLEELNSLAPEIYTAAKRAFDGRFVENQATRFTKSDYDRIPQAPIDKAVMEVSKNVALVPLEAGWSDVGSWQKLWEISEQDKDGVSASGDTIYEECRNSLLRSESRLVACVGLENIAVVETADAVLVANKAADDGIRALVQQLNDQARPETNRHLSEKRPWGTFQILMEQTGFKIKKLALNPGGRLSLQSHKHRTEHWVVVSGKAKITRGQGVEILTSNQSTYIPANVQHRLENIGPETLQVIEVQCGDYLGEDDIQRYEDAYGRPTDQKP